MSLGNLLEMAIIAFIVGTLAFVVWKGGASNPVGTGGLDRKLVRVDADMKAMGGRVDADMKALSNEVSGIRDWIEGIEGRLEEIDRRSAKATDIKRLEKQVADQLAKVEDIARGLATSREDAAARAATLDHVRRQIDALFDVIMKKGMGG